MFVYKHSETIENMLKNCNRNFLISEWFPRTGNHIKVQEVVSRTCYFTTKRMVLTKMAQ